MTMRVTIHPLPQADRADPATLMAQAEQQYGLPPGILPATRHVESGDGANMHSGQADGSMQFAPATAAAMHIDPMDDAQAIPAAAKLWRQNLDASGGDIDRAAMMYHGGPDTRQWGPKTHAYPGKLLAALGPTQSQASQPDMSDPIEAGVAGHAPTPSAKAAPAIDMSDPIEAGVAGASSAPAPQAPPAPATAPPAAPMGGGQRFNLGAEKGLADGIDGPAQMMEHGVTALGNVFGADNLGPRMSHAVGMPSADDVVKQRAAGYAKALQGNAPGVAGGIGEFVGNAVPTALAGLVTGGGSALGSMAVSGAAAGASQPNADTSNYWGDAAKSGAIGAAGGIVGGKIMQGAASVISPKVAALVKALQAHGVPLTPGQIVGANGGWIGKGVRTIEDAAMGVPFLGSAIKNAQNRSLTEANRAVVNRSLGKIGQALPADVATGHDAIAHAGQAIGNAYNDIIPKLATKADQPFMQNVLHITQMAQQPGAMAPAMAQRLQDVLRNDVFRRFSANGSITGQAYRELESKLGGLAKEFGSSPDPDHRQFGNAVGQLQAELRGLAERSNPAQAANLKKIHGAFRDLATVQKAAAGTPEGVFNGAQLGQAVRSSDTTARKSATAGGKANLQDLSKAMRVVLPSTVNDSGTATRGLMTGLLAGHLGGVLAPLAGGVAGGGLIYSKSGQKLAEALLTKRPQGAKALADAVRRSVPVAVAGGAEAGVRYAK